jgi:hypothetical protein
MELEEIRQISLVGFLENLGHMPVSRKGNDVWFRSPFRNERTASFKVDTQRNVWLDFHNNCFSGLNFSLFTYKIFTFKA